MNELSIPPPSPQCPVGRILDGLYNRIVAPAGVYRVVAVDGATALLLDRDGIFYVRVSFETLPTGTCLYDDIRSDGVGLFTSLSISPTNDGVDPTFVIRMLDGVISGVMIAFRVSRMVALKAINLRSVLLLNEETRANDPLHD